jgi:hypothetical protein
MTQTDRDTPVTLREAISDITPKLGHDGIVWVPFDEVLAVLDAHVDVLRVEVERIVGNGYEWASEYAYQVLVDALATPGDS